MPRAKPAPPRLSRSEVVRVALARRGWTQADLALSLDVTRQRVSDVLCGRVRASDHWWARVAHALDLPFADLAVGHLAVDCTRPAAELELCLDGDAAAGVTAFVALGDRAEGLLVALGYRGCASIAGDGDEWRCLVQRARHARVALQIRLDLPPLA